MSIPRATGDKGVKRISLNILGTQSQDRVSLSDPCATTCHKQEEGAFDTFHINKDSSLDVSTQPFKKAKVHSFKLDI